MGLPKPFQRPSINLGGGPKKDWQEVEASAVVRGDNVRGYGTVEWITWYDTTISIKWQNGSVTEFDPSDRVTAFTAV